MEKKTAQWVLIILIAACILTYVVVSRQPPEDGWASGSDGTSYFLGGSAVTGWQEIDGSRFYFADDGLLRTGWQTIDGATYYFAPNGSMHTGWLELDGVRYYLDVSGRLVTGWHTVDDAQYYFGTDGVFVTGIVEYMGKDYLFSDQGLVTDGWTVLDGKHFYGDAGGHPARGWTEIDGRQHCFDETGAALTGWQEMDGFTYYFYTDGSPAQGELTIDGTVHHFASNGQLLLLVNPWNHLPEDYTVELVPISETHQIAAIAYQDYLDMIADCKAAGLDPAVCSSYRTQEYQETLYQNRIDRYKKAGYSKEAATELAGHSVAVPGTSEHQLGLALDIVDNENWRLDESQAEMPTQKWLMENSWRYGWILRYPSEKSEITGIIYEPWHYRYVGKTVAKEIYDLGVCLEEYLQMLSDSVG